MSDILTTLRKYRIFRLSAVEVIGTMVMFYFIGKNMKSDNPILYSILSLPISIAVHKLFNVDTPLTSSWNELVEGEKNHKTTGVQPILSVKP